MSSANAKVFPESKKFSTIDRIRTFLLKMQSLNTIQYLLAYASDFNLVSTSLYPHGHSVWESKMQVARLDHAMWYHRDFRMDEWLLYVMQSPNACKARGLCEGRIYTRGGKLAASVVQEGLIRYHAA